MSTPELPLLSIVIVAYRSVTEIRGCVASLPRTLLGRWVETVVVDNSPGDGAGDFLREEYPWIHYVPAPSNLGFGRACNAGFQRTRGEYVLFLNPDTVANEAALLHCLRRLRDDPGIGLISPRLVQEDGTMDLACRRSIPTLWDGFCRASGLAARFSEVPWMARYNLTHLPVRGTYDVGAINGAFMLGARRTFTGVAVDGAVFDERFFMYGDDLDLCIRVAQAGGRIVYDGTVEITHLKGLSVARDWARMSQAIFDANRDVYLKHFNPRRRWWVSLKYVAAFGLWKHVARLRARLRRHRRVRPL